jgi:hypothetical protein
MVLIVLLGVLVALTSLSSAARSAAPNLENLRELAPILEVKLKEWSMRCTMLQRSEIHKSKIIKTLLTRVAFLERPL